MRGQVKVTTRVNDRQVPLEGDLYPVGLCFTFFAGKVYNERDILKLIKRIMHS